MGVQGCRVTASFGLESDRKRVACRAHKVCRLIAILDIMPICGMLVPAQAVIRGSDLSFIP